MDLLIISAVVFVSCVVGMAALGMTLHYGRRLDSLLKAFRYQRVRLMRPEVLEEETSFYLPLPLLTERRHEVREVSLR
jgi:hypothetical protein